MAERNSDGEVESKIKYGDTEVLKELTRGIFADPALRAAWAEKESIWKAIAYRLDDRTNNIASFDAPKSTEATVAILQLVNNLAATNVAAEMAFNTGFLEDVVNLEFPSSLRRYLYQILANLSLGFDSNMSEQIEKLVTIGLDMSSLEFYDVSGDVSIAFPILFMHKNIARALKEINEEVGDRFVVLWGSIIRNLSTWFGSPDSYEVLLKESMELAVISFSGGLFAKLASKFDSSADMEYPFFKIFASVIETASSDDEQMKEVAASNGIQESIAVTAKLLHRNLSEFSKALASGQDRFNNLLLGLTVIEQLRLCTSLLKIVPTAIPEYRDELVKPLVETLISAKALPARSKLKASSKDTTDRQRPEDFPYLKCLLLTALTEFVFGDKKTQDFMREAGGLAVVLECCIIDENNPFMKEHAILCIRYLLENNAENKAFVEKMEAKQVVNPGDLEKAGYETEIVNGKIAIKKSDQ